MKGLWSSLKRWPQSVRLVFMWILFLAACSGVQPSFFVTSVGNRAGGDYGGLEGADARCAELAEAADLPRNTWRAYLSTNAGPVHARDRIGTGPWYDTRGNLIATDVDALHANGLPRDLRDEFGALAARGDPPGPEHDILTGSNTEGMVTETTWTCQDWTSSSG